MKAPGGDTVIELLEAGGDDAVEVLTSKYATVHGRRWNENLCMFRSTKKEECEN